MNVTHPFPGSFRIGDRRVGGDGPVFFIAEAGVAHFGDMDKAVALLDLATGAGADCFKIQVFDADEMIAATLPEWRARLAPRCLRFEEVRALKEMCEARGIVFLATAHDPSRLAWLRELDVDAVKIGSGERNNTPFLREVGALGKPVILSTGMYTIADVEEAVTALSSAGCRELAVLHCVTAYPTADAEVNLRAMDCIADIFAGPVGYSDHTPDHLAVLAAVARGARIIEKHITLERDIPNAQDWKVSAGPEDLAQLVTEVRRVETMLGARRKAPSESEIASGAWALKFTVAARDLPAGSVLTLEDLAFKRAGGGVAPDRAGQIVGRRLARAVSFDHPIAFEDLE
jgi:N-acetylneuraminate synthase/N,N'-diacetyllegionaminate synthase